MVNVTVGVEGCGGWVLDSPCLQLTMDLGLACLVTLACKKKKVMQHQRWTCSDKQSNSLNQNPLLAMQLFMMCPSVPSGTKRSMLEWNEALLDRTDQQKNALKGKFSSSSLLKII